MSEYVKEILSTMPQGLTRDQFWLRCRPDINAGCASEVAIAWSIYKKRAA